MLVGAGLLADAVVTGGARVSLFLVFPVVSGGSAEFLLGLVAFVLGLFTLPLALATSETLVGDDAREGPGGGLRGGVVLVGPVPIFFGDWRAAGRRDYFVWAVVGSLVLGLLVAVALAWALFG